jgi:hypothetical protein
MKKIFAIAAIATLVFSACNKVEDVVVKEDQKAIQFESYSHTATKGAAWTKADFTEFTVKAYRTVVSPASTSLYFATQVTGTIAEYGTLYDWSTATTYYWPLGCTKTPATEKMNFYGFANVPSVMSFAKADNGGAATLSYEVPAAAASQNDVLAAKSVEDMVYSKEQGADNHVKMYFNHIMSQVAVSLNVNSLSQDARYIVKNVTLGKASDDGSDEIKNKGTYTFSTEGGSWSVDDAVTSYPIVSSNDTISVTGHGAATTATTTELKNLNGTNNNWMLMPQTFASDLHLRVVFDVYIKDASNQWVQIAEVDKALVAAGPTATIKSWEMGKKYTYNLTLNGDSNSYKILFQAAMSDWDATTAALPIAY